MEFRQKIEYVSITGRMCCPNGYVHIYSVQYNTLLFHFTLLSLPRYTFNKLTNTNKFIDTSAGRNANAFIDSNELNQESNSHYKI